MGIGDWVDDRTQGLRDTVGGAVQKGTTGAADVLDDAGFDGAAKKVRQGSGWVGEQLGARLEELELGESDDPGQLLHGDPKQLNERAAHLHKFASAFERTGNALRRLDPQGWHGKAADRFREEVSTHPKRWLRAADAFEDAQKALEHYADTVEWARKQARQAVEQYEQAQRATDTAAAHYDKEVATYNGHVRSFNAAVAQGQDPEHKPQKPGEFHDPGEEGRASARHLLKEARAQRDDAARTAEGKISAAVEQAPAAPQGFERVKREFVNMNDAGVVGVEHFVGGLAKTGTSFLRLARTVNPQDPYNLTHPAQYRTNLQGVAGGLVRTANHPTELVKGVVGEGWKTDRSEAAATLVSNFIPGGGAAKAGAKAAARGAERSLAHGAEKSAAHGAAGAGERSAAAAPHPPMPSHQFGPGGAKVFEDFGGNLGQDFSHLKPGQAADHATAQALDGSQLDSVTLELNKLQDSFGPGTPQPNGPPAEFLTSEPMKTPPEIGGDGYAVSGGKDSTASGPKLQDGPSAHESAPETLSRTEFQKLSTADKHKIATAELFDGARSFDVPRGREFGMEHWDWKGKHKDVLDDSQLESLKTYTGSKYEQINNELRGLPHNESPNEVRYLAEKVDEALAKRPIPEDIKVVRGTGYEHWLHEHDLESPEDLIGIPIKENGFLSTSIGETPFSNQPAILHLRAPEGTPAAYVEDITLNPSENEILLGSGRVMRFNRIFKDDSGQYHMYGDVS